MMEARSGAGLCRTRSGMFKALLLWSLCISPGWAQDNAPRPADEMEAEFQEPPQSARPRVWWHWINGNVTHEGIAKDLDWMKRMGIGGIQHFDVGLTKRQIVDKRLPYMTPEWKEAFRFAARTADRLGLEMTIAASPGWSLTGGPWVQPKDGMKKLVWSETAVAGGQRFSGRLAAPPSVTGPFQALAGSNHGASYYADALVLAYPDQQPPSAAVARFLSGQGRPFDAAALSDDQLQTSVTLDYSVEQPALILNFDSPQTIRSAMLFVRDAKGMFSPAKITPRLEARDGTGWRTVADFPLSAVPTTVSFAPVAAREFRLSINPVAGTAPPRAGLQNLRLSEFRLSTAPRIDQFEVKAGFDIARDYYATPAGSGPDAAGIDPAKIIDLTDKMGADGMLNWTPPVGRWRVLRMGYSLLGVSNHPAAPEATGLEVDKYDAPAVRAYMGTYLDMYRDAAGPGLLGARGINAMLTDSIEVGASNWTPKILEQFQRLRGYDPQPWLPALTGVVVGSRTRSDGFLYDFRRTLADLMSSEHYGQVARAAHEAGLKVYGESHEGSRNSFGDDMTMRSHADVPMAALWTFDREAGPNPTALADLRGAASVAHVYGQNLVAAESLTSMAKPWAFGPADLRPIIDLAFAHGVNRPVIHTSVHQPIDAAPGISLSIFGQYFNRLETWSGMARPWIDYLARTSFMLQQGRNVADVAYFKGEEGPLTGLHGDEPVRFAYDFVNADMIREALNVDGGEIVAKGGARYRALYLGGSSHRMTLPVLRRLAEFAEAGATIVGAPPTSSPSLADDPAEFAHLVSRLWPGGQTTAVGKGRVINGKDIEAALATTGLGPDFSYVKASADSQILFVHRKVADDDIYFLSNRANRNEKTEARFRVIGKTPEIWRADTGRTEPVPYRADGNETVLPLDMGAEESSFVVFRKPAAKTAAVISNAPAIPVGDITGGWTVTFEPGRGAPASVDFPVLGSLSERAEPGIKYFSGVSTYTKSFELPRGIKPGSPLWLDLGQVADVAELMVNGKPAGIAWKAPYRVDIGKIVKRGSNRVEIRVANLWVNRLIGDAQPGAEKITSTVFQTYTANAPLRPSGLIGPVTLMTTASGE